MSRYSVSQIQVYIQCPLKYRFRYIDKILLPEFVENTDTLLWSLVHEALQYLYNCVNVFRIPSKEQLLLYYYSLWDSMEKNIKEKWWEIVNVHDNLTIDDFKYRWEVYLSKYYDKHVPFKDIQVVSTEKQISFQLAEGVNFLWYIDRLDKKWETFIINDYKTNKQLPTEEKEQYIEQLTLYWIWISQKYEKYFKSLKARLYFLHFDIEDEWDLTVEKMNQIKEKYVNIIREIEEKRFQYMMWHKKAFESNQSSLCSWCDYQSVCPLFSAINSDDEVVLELSDKSISDLVDEFVNVCEKIAELENEREWLKWIFQKYIIKKDPNDEKSDFILSWTEQNVKVTKNVKMNVLDKDKFLAKMKELGLFDKYADISRQNVNKIFSASSNVRLRDFDWIVESEISYVIKKQKK